jgi:hypothetical protein
VLRCAGLAKTGGYRRSVIEQSHGNLHAVHVLAQYRQAAA